MTAQISEKLRFEGENLAMCTAPLSQYLQIAGAKSPFSDITCTALWRGYVGSWEIIGNRLYLVGLEGTLADGAPASLEALFPGFGTRVFAHWYSGTLRIPKGRLLKYVHMGYGSTYERDLFIEIERGVVEGTRTVVNGTGEAGGGDGYGVAGMTVFPGNGRGGGAS